MHLTVVAVTAAFSVVAFASAAVAAPPPAAAFGRREAVQAAAISPDGTKVATVGGTMTQRTLTIATLDQPDPVALDLGAVRTLGVQWGGNDHVLVRVTMTQKEAGWKYSYDYTRDLIFDTKGKLKGWLLQNSAESAFDTGFAVYKIVHGIDGEKAVAYVRGLDGKPNIARNDTRFAEDDERSILTPALYKVDVATGRGTLVERGNSSGYAIDKDGELRGKIDPVEMVNSRVRIDDQPYTVFGRGKGQSGWKAMATIRSRGVSVEGYSAPEDALYWTQEDGDKGVRRLHKVSFKDGTTSIVPVPDNAVDVDMWFDPENDEPIAVTYTTGGDEQHQWMQPKFQAVYTSLSKAFKGKNVELRDWSIDRTKFIVEVWSSDEPTVWYLFDGTRKEVSLLGEEYPELKGASLGKKTFYHYKASDGLTIPSYLHVPVASSGKNLPLIVLPHGGPAVRDYSNFDWWAQFFASRGYAVLQPQYRGSAGFGYDFRMAGRKQFGGKMETDILDGVRDLAAKGVIDPKRVCIAGWSDGGFHAFYGATHLGDVYKCAISVNGVADQGIWVGQMVSRYGHDMNLLNDLIGDNREEVARGSPLAKAGDAKAPVLIVYGSQDTTVPPKEQSVAMADRLRSAGKDVTVVELPGDDHHLHNSASRIRMLEATDAFLAKHLPTS
jgi:dipeptidyl aminopeptidase/acylaminoacyl peptidase